MAEVICLLSSDDDIDRPLSHCLQNDHIENLSQTPPLQPEQQCLEQELQISRILPSKIQRLRKSSQQDRSSRTTATTKTMTARSKTIQLPPTNTIHEDLNDSIIFTSSIEMGHPEASTKIAQSQPAKNLLHSDGLEDLPESVFDYSAPVTLTKGLSDKTMALLSTLGKENAPVPKDLMATKGRRKRVRREQSPTSSLDEVDSLSQRSIQHKRLQRGDSEKSAKQTGDAIEKAKDRELQRLSKIKDKEEQVRMRQEAKENKAEERRVAAALAEVNKIKLDKKDCTPEMIIDMAASMHDTIVGRLVIEIMKTLTVEVGAHESIIPNVIKWRRKVKASWNSELEHWEPLKAGARIDEEHHVLILLSAQEFVTLASSQVEAKNIDNHVARLKQLHKDCKVMYLIEGMQKWMAKNKTAENHAYQARARGTEHQESETTSRKKSTHVHVDETILEDAFLSLQVKHGCLIHHADRPNDSAQWIASFTQHISTIPYRRQRKNLSTSFCMDSGQIKTGEDNQDTFIRMLQEVVRITPSIAFGIASEYSRVSQLVNAFRQHGPLILEDLKKSANRDGAFTNRRIGPALSKRLHSVFMETDPTSMDV